MEIIQHHREQLRNYLKEQLREQWVKKNSLFFGGSEDLLSNCWDCYIELNNPTLSFEQLVILLEQPIPESFTIDYFLNWVETIGFKLLVEPNESIRLVRIPL